MKPKVIFFDFGDTLVHFKHSVYGFWAELLVQNELVCEPIEVLCKRIYAAIHKEWAFRNGDDITWVKDDEAEREYWRTFYKAVLIRLGINDVLDAVLDEFLEGQMDPSSYEQFDDVLEVLGKLNEKGFELGIIANAFPSANRIFEKQEIDEYFAYCFWSYESYRDQGILPKPEASEKGLYRFALRSVGLKAEETFFVDDRPKFVEGALEIGMGAVLLDREFVYQEWGKDFKIQSLRDILSGLLTEKSVRKSIVSDNVESSILSDESLKKSEISSGNTKVVETFDERRDTLGVERAGKEKYRLPREGVDSASTFIEAGLASWLEKAGLKKHPFDYFVTEDDLYSTIESFCLGKFDKEELLTDHRTYLIVGNRGSGKTALAEYLIHECYPTNASSKVLSLYWGKVQFSKLLAFKSKKDLTPYCYGREIVQNVIDYIDINGLQVDQLVEIPEQINNFAVVSLFNLLISRLMKLGFGKLIICIDQVNQILGIGREIEKIISMIEPFMQIIEQIECKDVGFRFFLPEDVLDELIKRKSVHFDHMLIEWLEWEDMDIQSILSKRLQLASVSLRSPIESLGQLTQIENIDRRVAELANRNPRSAIWLSRELINQHYRRDPTMLKFSDQDWLEVQKTWVRRNRILCDDRGEALGFYVSDIGDIYYFDQEIRLRGTRADIMRFLIKRIDSGCTDEEIAEVIYPEADLADLSNRVVPEAVRHLKDDLALYGLEKHIERVRGKGFILLNDL